MIANTLSITIAQRTRELATMRTLGATRRQVLRSVLIEAFVIGLLASIVGLFLGLLLAKALNSLLVSFGIDLPQAGTVFKTRTVIVSLLRRRPDHARRRDAPGAARDAGPADRRGPRGRGAAAVAVRALRPVRRGARRSRSRSR